MESFRSSSISPKCTSRLGIGLVLQRRFLHLVTFGQFLAGNRFAEGKTTKLSSAWAGRHEEVLKGPFLRTVVVILGGVVKMVRVMVDCVGQCECGRMTAAHRRHDFSDQVWERLRPLLPGGAGQRGRPARDNRQF